MTTPGLRAPQRESNGNDERDIQSRMAVAREVLQRVGQHLERVRRQQIGVTCDLLLNSAVLSRRRCKPKLRHKTSSRTFEGRQPRSSSFRNPSMARSKNAK